MTYIWQDEFGEAYEGCRIVVTGVGGFIGGHLSEALITLGAEVFGISLEPDPPPWLNRKHYICMDLTNADSVQNRFEQIHPSVIFHLAGLVTANRKEDLMMPMLNANLISTVNILQAVNRSGCDRLIVTGTAEELGVSGNPDVPTSPYAASKAAATLYTRMYHAIYGLPTVIIRPFIVYGPRQAPDKLIPYVIRTLLLGETPVINSPERICDFIYVLDVVRGYLKAGLNESAIGRVFELGTGQGIKIAEIMCDLIELIPEVHSADFCNKGSVIQCSKKELDSIVADYSTASRILNWEIQWPLQVGLHETIQWSRGRLDT